MRDPARPDPLGLVTGGDETITGSVVCAAVIAYAAETSDSVYQLCTAILATVAVYWLAHLHADTIGSALTHEHHPRAAFQHALIESWPIMGAAGLPVMVLIASSAFGAELQTAAWLALGVSITLIAAYSYLAGIRGGLTTWGRIACAGVGAGLGVLVALMKVALH